MADIEVGDLVARISFDDTGLNRSMAEINRQMRLVQSEFDRASSALQNYGSAEERLQARSTSLTQQMALQQQRINLLNEQFQRSVRETGEAAAATQQLAIQLNQAQTAYNRMDSDLRQVTEDLADQDSELNDVSGSLDNAESKFSSFGKAALIGVAAAGAAAAGLFGLAQKASDAASEIGDMSVRTGLSTQFLQEMKFASEQTGVKFETFTGAVGRLTNVMAGAEEGGDKAQAAFAKLGIKTSDAAGNMVSMDAIFPEVIAKLSEMKNETERNALAMDFFGKGALELVPLLAQGESGIAALSQQAHDLGLVLSDEAIGAGDQFGDSLDAMKAALGGVFTAIGVELLPMFQSLFNWVMAHMPEIQEGISSAIEVVISLFKQFGEAIQFVTDNMNIILPVIAGITAAILAQMVIDGLVKLYKAWQTATTAQTTLQWLLNAALNANPLGLVALAIGAVVAAGVLLYKNWDVIKEKLGEFWDFLKDIGSKIKTFFGEVFGDLATGFKGYVNIWITALNFLIKGLNKLKFDIPDWVPGLGGKQFGINIPQIPMLANGGNIAQAGMALVGEAGPELLNLPRGAQVQPLTGPNAVSTDSGPMIAKFYLDGKEIATAIAKPLNDLTRNRARGLGLA